MDYTDMAFVILSKDCFLSSSSSSSSTKKIDNPRLLLPIEYTYVVRICAIKTMIFGMIVHFDWIKRCLSWR